MTVHTSMMSMMSIQGAPEVKTTTLEMSSMNQIYPKMLSLPDIRHFVFVIK